MTDREKIIRKARAALHNMDIERGAKEILEADRLIKESGGRVPVEMCCVFYPCGYKIANAYDCKGCSNSSELYWEMLVGAARAHVEAME